MNLRDVTTNGEASMDYGRHFQGEDLNILVRAVVAFHRSGL